MNKNGKGEYSGMFTLLIYEKERRNEKYVSEIATVKNKKILGGNKYGNNI